MAPGIRAAASLQASEPSFAAGVGRAPAAGKVGVVRDLRTLRRLTHAPLLGSMFHVTAPRLEFSEASSTELSNWQRRLERDLHACGCSSGAVTLVAALAILALLEFVAGFEIGSGLTRIAVWIGVGLGAATGGKAAGLLVAKVRRHRLYDEIERTLGSRHLPSSALASD